MATFPISISTFSLIFCLLTLYPIFSLSHKSLITNNLIFDPQIALLGDATIYGNNSFLQLTASNASSSGLLLQKDFFKFGPTTSFSTELEFSMTGNFLGLSLVIGPFNLEKKFLGRGQFDVLNKKQSLGIEFRNGMTDNGGDCVVIIVDKEPLGHFLTKRGQKVKSWIDYDASSKRLEIRICEVNNKRPYDPFIALPLDLSKILGQNEVYVGLLGSKNGGNALETCNVYLWRFRLRTVPKWMHSLPVNPHGSVDNGNSSNGNLREHMKKFCPLTVLAGLIFATGCGALLAFVVLFMWAILGNRQTVFPVDGEVQPVDFRYEKIGVVVEKAGKVVEN